MARIAALALSALLVTPAYAGPPPAKKKPPAAAKKKPATKKPKRSATPKITPEKFRKSYFSLRINRSTGKALKVSLPYIHYQDRNYPGTLQKAGEASWDKLRGLANDLIKKDRALVDKLTAPVKIKSNDLIFQFTFKGNGTPDEIAAVAAIAYELRSKIADWPSSITDPTTAVQDYIVNHIGLNCDGFASAYARTIGGKETANISPSQWLPITTNISDLNDVHAGDVLIFKDGKNEHIALIQARIGSSNELNTVESGKDQEIDGLTKTRWKVEPIGKAGATPAIFKATCTSHPTRPSHTVYLQRIL